jgi:hypothetical protein
MTPHCRAVSSLPSKLFKLQLVVAALTFTILAGGANAQNSGLYIYPSKGQSEAQQNKDKYECNTWAVSQTGFDPNKAQTTSTTQQQKPQGHVVRGAARGAALGAVGGAIAGNAGTGAAAGAAMGGLAGGFRRRDANTQQQANTQAAASSGQDAYNRALAACLQGRGYTVN